MYTHPLFRLPTQENKHTKLNTIWQDKRTGASSQLKLATNETRTNCDNAMVMSGHVFTPTIIHTNKHATFGDSTLVDDLLVCLVPTTTSSFGKTLVTLTPGVTVSRSTSIKLIPAVHSLIQYCRFFGWNVKQVFSQKVPCYSFCFLLFVLSSSLLLSEKTDPGISTGPFRRLAQWHTM